MIDINWFKNFGLNSLGQREVSRIFNIGKIWNRQKVYQKILLADSKDNNYKELKRFF